MKKIAVFFLAILTASFTWAGTTGAIVGPTAVQVGEVQTYSFSSNGTASFKYAKVYLSSATEGTLDDGTYVGPTTINVNKGAGTIDVHWGCTPGTYRVYYEAKYGNDVKNTWVSVVVRDFSDPALSISGPLNGSICLSENGEAEFQTTVKEHMSHYLWRIYTGDQTISPNASALVAGSETVSDLTVMELNDPVIFKPLLPVPNPMNPSNLFTVEVVPYPNKCLKEAYAKRFLVDLQPNANVNISLENLYDQDCSANQTAAGPYQWDQTIELKATVTSGTVNQFYWELPSNLEACQTTTSTITNDVVRVRQIQKKLSGEIIRLQADATCRSQANAIDMATYNYQPQPQPGPIEEAYGPRLVCLQPGGGSTTKTFTIDEVSNASSAELTVNPPSGSNVVLTENTTTNGQWNFDVTFSLTGTYTLTFKAKDANGIYGDAETVEVEVHDPTPNFPVYSVNWSWEDMDNGVVKELRIDPCVNDVSCASVKIKRRYVRLKLNRIGSAAIRSDVYISHVATMVNGITTGVENKYMLLDNDQPVSYVEIDVSFDDFNYIEIDPWLIVGTVGSKFVEMSAELIEEYGYLPKAGDVLSQSGNTSTQDYETLNWTAPCVSYENYQVQLLRLFNEGTDANNYLNSPYSIKATINWDEALTIETQSVDNFLKIRPGMGSGYYVWRVRPIGNYYDNSEADARNYGDWSTNGNAAYQQGAIIDFQAQSTAAAATNFLFYYDAAPQDKNWAYQRSFIEAEPATANGIRMYENLTFANGLGMAKQQLSASGVDQEIVAQQSVYDYAGRPSLNSLPVPLVSEALPAYQYDANGLFHYRQDFLKNQSNGEAFSAADFDEDAKIGATESARTNSGDAFTYYSTTSADNLVPSAEGYPFSRTWYYPDGTQRPRAEFSPGINFADKSGSKATRYYYSSAPEDELIRLFGDEAPADTTVRQLITLDPNGVQSLSYINSNGKVIATALVIDGNNPTDKSGTMDGLITKDLAENSYTVEETLKVAVQTKPYENVMSTQRNFPVSTACTIDYNITPALIQDCYNFCATCDYEVEIKVWELDDPNNPVYSKTLDIEPLLNCSTQTVSADASPVTLSLQGTYFFQRTLRAKNVDENDADKRSYLQTHLDAIESNLRTAYEALIPSTAWEKINGFPDPLNPTETIFDPTAFYTEINQNMTPADWEARTFTIPGSVNSCAPLSIPINICGDPPNDNPTDPCLNFDFERYFYAYQIHRYETGELENLDEFGAVFQESTDPQLSAQIVMSNISGPLHFAGNTETLEDPNRAGKDIYEFHNGEFNTMVNNMLNDGYSCTEVMDTWKNMVKHYATLKTAFDDAVVANANMFQNPPEFNLIKLFLDKMRRDMRDLTEDAAPSAPAIGYRSHAYRAIYFDFGRTTTNCELIYCSNAACTQSVYGNLSQNDRNELAKCIEAEYSAHNVSATHPFVQNNSGGTSLQLATNAATDMKNDCDAACVRRRPQFIQALIDAYHDIHVTVTGHDANGLIANPMPYYPAYVSAPAGTTGTFTNSIALTTIEDLADRLVDECKSANCNFAAVEVPAASGKWQAYTQAQLDDYNLVLGATFLVRIKEGANCPTAPSGAVGYNTVNYTQGLTSIDMCFSWLDQTSVNINGDLLHNFTIPSCEEETAEQIRNNLQTAIGNIIRAEQLAFTEAYNDNCIVPNKVSDLFTLSYPGGQHHFTLYYYDRAGRLIKTVPPEGTEVLALNATSRSRTEATDHTLPTTYSHNSLGWLSQQTTPDGGTTDFVYDRLGQLRFSQNEVQKLTTPPSYSYTKYDDLGRIVEVGVSSEEPDFGQTTNTTAELAELEEIANTADFPSNPLVKSEVVKTHYSTNFEAVNALYPDGQRHLQNRVSYTRHWGDDNAPSADDFITIYSYDAHGNVAWMVQQHPILGWSQVEYTYDLLSGNVKQVAYNPEKVDQFFHRYTYDERNRLEKVETSSDGRVWEADATYQYYAHGPLKRSVLGHEQLQGLDYVYTINGWLKAINQVDDDVSKDPGLDGDPNHNHIPQDLYALQLHYFSNDYLAGNTNLSTNDLATTAQADDLYNGNIAALAYRQQAADQFVNGNRDKTVGFAFRYDELNRLTQSSFLKKASNWSTSPEFETTFEYDANGNITKLIRFGNSTAGLLMDELDYTYQQETNPNHPGKHTNRLLSVNDSETSNNYNDDIKGTHNYIYDAIGNLISDVNEEIASIEWNTAGKVTKVNRTSGSNKDHLAFDYDAAGNRVSKRVMKDLNDPTTWEMYYYSRDAQGNVMATYKGTISDQGGGSYKESVRLLERPIYGSDRLGMSKKDVLIKEVLHGSTIGNTYELLDSIQYHDNNIYYELVGSKRFELKNHLGNVQTVFEDEPWYLGETPTLATNANLNQVDHVITKTAVDGWATGIGNSVETFSGDGAVEYTLTTNPQAVLFGLSSQAGTTGFDVDYGIFTQPSGRYQIIKNGSIVVLNSQGHTYLNYYAVGQVVRVERLGTDINFYVDGELLHSLDASADANIADPFFMELSIRDQNKSVSNVKLYDYKERELTVLSAGDYYPFGSPMPGRQFSSESYRYGFQGQEEDRESDWTAFTYRMHNKKLGRFFSIDPLAAKYPQWGPYNFSGNQVIASKELEGLEPDVDLNKNPQNHLKPIDPINESTGVGGTAPAQFSYEITGLEHNGTLNETLKMEGIPISVNGVEVDYSSTWDPESTPEHSLEILGEWKESPLIKFNSIDYNGLDEEAHLNPGGKIGAGIIGGKGTLYGQVSGTMIARKYIDGLLVSEKEVKLAVNVSKEFTVGVGVAPGFSLIKYYNTIKGLAGLATGVSSYIDAQEKVEEYGERLDLDNMAKALYAVER